MPPPVKSPRADNGAKGGKGEALVKRYINIADYDFASRLRLDPPTTTDWNCPTDRSGNWNDLNIAGGTKPNYRDSVMGRGMVFTTAGTAVTATLGKNLADADAFMIVWYGYFTNAGTTDCMVSRGADGSGSGWSLTFRRHADTTVHCLITKTSGGAGTVAADGTILVPDYIPVVCTAVWEPGVGLRTYINGVLDANTTTTATGLRDSTIGLRLGIANVDAAGTLDAVCSRLLIGNKVPDASVVKTLSMWLPGDSVNDFQVGPNDPILGPFDTGGTGYGWIPTVAMAGGG